MPLGIFTLAWPSAEILGYIMQIISNEVLGYNTVISGVGSTSTTAIAALAGCGFPAPGSPTTLVHPLKLLPLRSISLISK